MGTEQGNNAVDALVYDPEGIPGAMDPAPIPITLTTKSTPVKPGYSLWEFDGATWLLKKDRSKAGHVPSAPPSVPGRFRGQIRAVLAVPATARVIVDE
jgi:hypothetical protein